MLNNFHIYIPIWRDLHQGRHQVFVNIVKCPFSQGDFHSTMNVWWGFAFFTPQSKKKALINNLYSCLFRALYSVSIIPAVSILIQKSNTTSSFKNLIDFHAEQKCVDTNDWGITSKDLKQCSSFIKHTRCLNKDLKHAKCGPFKYSLWCYMREVFLSQGNSV